MSNYDVIGTVIIAEAQEPVTENHTYYAADYRTYRVQPGTYEIQLTRDSGSGWVLVTVDVEVDADVTFSGFGGVNFASNDRGPHTSTKTYQLYDYSVARSLCEGTAFLGGEAKLADDWAITVKHVTLKALRPEDEPRTHVSRKFTRV